MTEHADLGPRSTPALISYGLMALWAMTVGSVFLLVLLRIKVEDVMVGILGAILSTTSAGLTGVVGFWLAASAQANRKDTQAAGSVVVSPPATVSVETEGAK